MILAGVRALTIHDHKNVETRDLSAQFYITEEDVGQNRAEACKDKLQELNNAVAVSASSAELSAEYLGQFQVRAAAGALLLLQQKQPPARLGSVRQLHACSSSTASSLAASMSALCNWQACCTATACHAGSLTSSCTAEYCLPAVLSIHAAAYPAST